MKAAWTVPIGLSLILAACASTPAVAPAPTYTTTGGVTIATAPLSTASFDKAGLAAFSAAEHVRVKSVLSSLANVPKSRDRRISLLSSGLRDQRLPPLLPQTTGDGCTSLVNENLTDGDNDGILRNYTEKLECTNFSYLMVPLTYKGTWNTTDKDDANPKSGYRYDADVLLKIKGSKDGTAIDAAATFNYFHDIDITPSGGSKSKYLYDYSLKGTKTLGTVTQSLDASWRAEFTFASAPDADGKGQQFTFSGSSSTNGLSDGLSSGPAGAMTFSGSVHYTNLCPGTSGGGFDSGSVTYTSGGVTETYTIKDCIGSESGGGNV